MESLLLEHVPSLLLGALLIVVSVGGSLAGLWLVRRSVELRTLESHNDVAGFIIAVVGVLYAVMLAFVVVIVWQQFDAATGVADHEAALVIALYRDADAFTGQSADIRAALRTYAGSVVEDEWPSMAVAHAGNQRTDDALTAVFRAVRAVHPQSPGEEAFYTATVTRLNEVTEARRDRIFASASELPGPLWFLLLAGGAITVGFTYFFGLTNFRAHGLMVSALAAMVALTLFLILSLDLPFSGSVAVEPGPMRSAIHELTRQDR